MKKKRPVRRKRPVKKKTPAYDSTSVKFPDTLVDYVPPKATGYPESKAVWDTPENLEMMGARDFPDDLYIDPKDWKDAARENDKYKSWAESHRVKWGRFTNQNPTHECTCHALAQCFEAAWHAQRLGEGHPIAVSQISIYAEANPRQWGGAGCQQVLGIAMRRGFLPEPIRGQKDLFQHTLHGTCGRGNNDNSSGRWVAVRNFPEGWETTAQHLKPTEVINPRTFDQVICCLLRGRAVGVGRSGHSIPYTHVVWRNGQIYAGYSDSYDVVRYDSRRMINSAVGGSYCIWNTTTPDDWANPAGDDSP